MTPLPIQAAKQPSAQPFNDPRSIRSACQRVGLLLLAVVWQMTASLALAADPIIPPDAKLEKLFEGVTLTEGVAVAPDGQVYFSDITFSHTSLNDRGQIHAGHIWRFDPATGKTTIFRSPSGMSNGIKFDAAGDMIVCEGADYGGRRVIRTDMKTGMSFILAAMYDGRPLNSPNDVTIDEKGRLYFSDPRYLGHEPIDQPVVGVYRIDPDGSIHRIISDAGKANGVCVSPDQKSLYVISNENGATGFERLDKAPVTGVKSLSGNVTVQTVPTRSLRSDSVAPGAKLQADKVKTPLRKGLMALLAYDLHADGTATFRQVLADYSPQDGPDGLVCDRQGNLIVAVRAENRPGVYVYSPEGKEIGYLKTEVPTNVGFGRGPDENLLYLTAGKSLYRIRLNCQGYHLPPR